MLQSAYDGQWSFYIVTPLVEAEGIQVAYLRLAEAMRPIVDDLPTFDLSTVRLVGTTQPLGRDLLAAFQQMPSHPKRPFRWKGIRLGGHAIENAYFYPLPASKAAPESQPK